MANPLAALPPHSALRPFEAAARLGSISAAARELGVTQPAISRHLTQLEADLRQPLFERTARGLRLTEAGRAFQAAVAPALAAIAEAADSLRAPDRDRTIRLAANTGFAQQWLAPRLSALRAAMPNLYLRLSTTDRDEDFDDGDYDLAVRFGAGGWAGCRATQLLPERVTPICAPAYLRERPGLDRPDLPASALLGERLLHLDEQSARWFTWRTWLQSLGVAAAIPPPKLLYPSYPLLLQAAVAGEGVALGWAGLIDDLFARHWIVALPLESRRDDHGYFLCQRERRPMTQAKQAVVSKLATWLTRATAGG
jgi:LysR family transcriptional regulator, glycine cleavage system transcriptional activator